MVLEPEEIVARAAVSVSPSYCMKKNILRKYFTIFDQTNVAAA